MHVNLPGGSLTLAASTLIIAPASEWPSIIESLRQNLHEADWWRQADPEKPVSIADVRALQQFAVRSSVGEQKIACIEQADKLRLESINALLKLVEEPPPYLRIVLLSETDHLLPTLASRLRKLRIGKESATISSNGLDANAWQRTFARYDLADTGDRERADRLQHLYPLVHSGIKEDTFIESLS